MDTIVKFLRAYDGPLTAHLASVGGSGTPNADGYACTDNNGLQSFVVPEVLIGEFYLWAVDADGETAYQSYVSLDDTEEVYRANDLGGRWVDESGQYVELLIKDRPSLD